MIKYLKKDKEKIKRVNFQNGKNIFPLYNMVRKINKRYGRTIAIPVGKCDNGKLIYETIKDASPMYVYGSIGSGKSVFLDDVIVSLCVQNNKKFKMVLIDPKTFEFDSFEGSSKLFGGRIYRQKDEINEVLHKVTEIMQKRVGRNIKGLKTKRTDDIIIVIDEIADLVLWNSENLEMIADILKRGSEYGIYLIFTSQTEPVNKYISYDKLLKHTKSHLLFNSYFKNVGSILNLDMNLADLPANGFALFVKNGIALKLQIPFVSYNLVAGREL